MAMLTETEWLKINTIIGDLHQMSDERSVRKYFLQAVKELLFYDFGIFDLSKLKGTTFISLYDPVVQSCFDADFEKRFIVLHDEQFCHMSYTRWIHHEKKPIVYNETDIINEEVRKKSQYYTDYLKPGGLVYSCGYNLVHNEINLGAVSFYRKKENGDFSGRDLYILERLQPHTITKISQYVDPLSECNPRTKFSLQYELTNREVEIVELVYKGLKNQDIGNALHISVNTVKKHLNNVFCKMDVKSRSQLIHLVTQNDFL